MFANSYREKIDSFSYDFFHLIHIWIVYVAPLIISYYLPLFLLNKYKEI